MWVWSGLVLSAVLANVALWRARAKTRSYYEGAVYGMDAWGHRKWAAVFCSALFIFGAELRFPEVINRIPQAEQLMVPLLDVVVLAGILYLATFARGATGEDE